MKSGNAAIGPDPIPDLPVDPSQLPGKLLDVVHASAKSWNSIPNPNGGSFGVSKAEFSLTIDMLSEFRSFNFWDAVAEAQRRAATSGPIPAAYAVLQGRNGMYYIALIRTMPRGDAFTLLDMPDRAALNFDSPKVRALKAIVGKKFWRNFSESTTPPPTLRGMSSH